MRMNPLAVYYSVHLKHIQKKRRLKGFNLLA